MTVQHIPQPSTVARAVDKTRRTRIVRWAVAAGLAVVAATAVIGVTQYRDQGSTQTEVTRSQVLVQGAIDEALAANRTGEVTRSQVLVQGAIDAALAANHTTDYTRAQTLVQQSIDSALASS